MKALAFNQLKVHPFQSYGFRCHQPAPLHRGDLPQLLRAAGLTQAHLDDAQRELKRRQKEFNQQTRDMEAVRASHRAARQKITRLRNKMSATCRLLQLEPPVFPSMAFDRTKAEQDDEVAKSAAAPGKPVQA